MTEAGATGSEDELDDDSLVLVVDDDAGVAWAIEQALASEGYLVRIAADAASAKRKVARSRPDGDHRCAHAG